MKITVAIDSLKGSLTSMEAGYAISEGISRVYPDAEVCVRPLADGGEGTVEALIAGMDGVYKKVKVTVSKAGIMNLPHQAPTVYRLQVMESKPAKRVS